MVSRVIDPDAGAGGEAEAAVRVPVRLKAGLKARAVVQVVVQAADQVVAPALSKQVGSCLNQCLSGACDNSRSEANTGITNHHGSVEFFCVYRDCADQTGA